MRSAAFGYGSRLKHRVAPHITGSATLSNFAFVVVLAASLLSVGYFSSTYLFRKGHGHSHDVDWNSQPVDLRAVANNKNNLRDQQHFSATDPVEDPRAKKMRVPPSPSSSVAASPTRSSSMPESESATASRAPSKSAAGSPSPSGTPAASPAASVAPSVAPSPPPAPAAVKANLRREDHPDRYLMLVQAQEGFGAWNDAIFEFLDLARELNRTFVEPCVRNGCLEPCRCGAITMVDIDGTNVDKIVGEHDLLDLPYIDYVCEPYTGHHRAQVGWSYPLRAYADLHALMKLAGWEHMIGYDDWCENVMKKDKTTPQRDLDKRWVVKEGGYCGELHDHWCEQGDKTQGDFVFSRHFGRPSDISGFMGQLMGMRNLHTLYFYGYYRGYFGRREFRNIPFNLGHHRAVQNYAEKHFGANPMVVFHWRSEHVDEDMLVPCARTLQSVIDRLKFADNPTHHRALLMSDMPSPNNEHIIWHTYTSSNGGGRHGAMAVMTGAGDGAYLLKYDGVHNGTDTGVLMIRDFLFGVYADAYITCQGDFHDDCNGCFRSNSNFVSRIVQTRARLQRPSMDKWLQVGQDVIPAQRRPEHGRSPGAVKAGEGLT